MKNYLSMGFGVNSVALYLLLTEQGVDFEAVFVHHGTDWPETYDYAAGFQWWLKRRGLPPITILRPLYGGNTNLFEYCWRLKIVPVIYPRWCTSNFKIKAIERYYKPPAFDIIGIDAGESHRAKISTKAGLENRYPLIEQGIDRQGCIEIIKAHNLPVPQKSGCYICPYQSIAQWKQLRTAHPELFCDAVRLEERNAEYRRGIGKKPMTISPRKIDLINLVDEKQMRLWKQDEYPPCQCGL